jgi:prepilin-type N-terminal cleavage/methylation domain-containing protein
MQSNHQAGRADNAGNRQGFTLVEMLAVIAIIGILAGLALTLLPNATVDGKRKRTKSQLTQIQTAIESYHAKNGFYPPDSPTGTSLNQLYYELTGVVWDGSSYTDVNGQPVNTSTLGVGGIVNAVKPGEKTRNFFGDAKIETVDMGGALLLKVPLDWPDGFANPPLPGKPTANVWHYNSSRPEHNKQSYDLWAELVIKKKVVRISNWERQ